ncbi:MAG: hypothetical protein DRQ58_06820 [Gammaproteobacteria bacterium]|nr:MAG: hypothetical protein DRQ58_06820 [Gammaproteobacteria bacterium]
MEFEDLLDWTGDNIDGISMSIIDVLEGFEAENIDSVRTDDVIKITFTPPNHYSGDILEELCSEYGPSATPAYTYTWSVGDETVIFELPDDVIIIK